MATIFLQLGHQFYAVLVISQCLTAYNVLLIHHVINARLVIHQEHVIAVSQGISQQIILLYSAPNALPSSQTATNAVLAVSALAAPRGTLAVLVLSALRAIINPMLAPLLAPPA